MVTIINDYISQVVTNGNEHVVPWDNRFLKAERASSLFLTLTLYNNIKIRWDGSHQLMVMII